MKNKKVFKLYLYKNQIYKYLLKNYPDYFNKELKEIKILFYDILENSEFIHIKGKYLLYLNDVHYILNKVEEYKIYNRVALIKLSRNGKVCTLLKKSYYDNLLKNKED